MSPNVSHLLPLTSNGCNSHQVHSPTLLLLSSTCLYGGVPKMAQRDILRKGVSFIVATPGRLKDLVEEQSVSLANVSYLVLDEADRMLDMGFLPDIRAIVNACKDNDNRQVRTKNCALGPWTVFYLGF